MLVIINLNGRINAASHRYRSHLPVPARQAQIQILLRFKARAQTQHVEPFRPVQLERLGIRALFELQGQHSHTDQV